LTTLVNTGYRRYSLHHHISALTTLVILVRRSREVPTPNQQISSIYGSNSDVFWMIYFRYAVDGKS